MAIASKSIAKFNPYQFADVIRESALKILESVQVKFEKTQEEGRIVLSQQVLKSANRANDLSKALTVLSKKIAPAARAKSAPKAKAKPAAKKPAVKTVAVKARARKAAVAA